MLVVWNQTDRDYPRERCVHQLFEDQAARTPDAVAVEFDGQSLSYHELNQAANRLARHLRARGVGPGEIVGLSVERSFERIIGLLGILKAGGAYLAWEDDLPDQRLRMLLAHARPRLLLVREKCAGDVRLLVDSVLNDQRRKIGTVAIEGLLASDCTAMVHDASAVRAIDPAYVGYTSGSTGLPKGVVVPHRGVVRLVMEADYVSLTAAETMLHHSPLSFDASTFELWGALLNGGRVVLLPPGPLSLDEIGKAIRQDRVTTLWLTAPLFHLMVDEKLNHLKPLRQLIAGGDVLSVDHVKRARHALPDCRLINGYGPTENTTFTCCYPVPGEAELASSVPIGRPIANNQVYVLDAQGEPVPVGVAGELYAGGDGVALGYLKEPRLTAERFVADWFRPRANGLLYRTGDWVRWRQDGNLEFLGRVDSQVKICGYRVEPGEIEAVLGSHPHVASCAVIVRESAGDDKTLAAFVVLRQQTAISAGSLREWLEERLPHYLIPSRFLTLPDLPRGSNGKVDRQTLRKFDAVELVAGTLYRAPWSQTERTLTEIWQTVLGRERVGAETTSSTSEAIRCWQSGCWRRSKTFWASGYPSRL